MNVGQSFDIQWIQPSPHDDSDGIIVNGCGSSADDDGVYLDDGTGHTADLDQIAAENLIFMARDGQVTDIIPTGTDEHGAVIVSASDGTQIDMMQQAGGITSLSIRRPPDDEVGCYTSAAGADFTDCTPQMVTEEVITDDWVQHQGEDRVEIAAEQIISCNSQVLLDMEVPLPTDQDEYTVLRPYPCDFCSRRFRKKVSLLNHMVAHKNDRPHLCKLCGSRFFRKTDLIEHLKDHANVNTDQDDFSLLEHQQQQQRSENERFYDDDWEMHEEPIIGNNSSSNAAADTTTSTTTNTTTTTSKTNARTTGRSRNQNNRDISRSSTLNSTEASSSTMTRGRISRLKPKEENYVIDETLALRTERMHSSEMDYVDCSTAAVKLTQDQSPAHQKHYPIIDNSKPFVCQECGLAFSREKALLAHIKNHRADSSHECSQCNEIFWDKGSLQDHQKTHQFEESNSEYDPAEGDDSETDSDSVHVYGEYYCSECGMSFHRQDLLRRHSKVHTKADSKAEPDTGDTTTGRHCCNTCGETFAEALDLLAHAEIHARYPPFKCILCGSTFYEEATIKRHLQTQHPKEMTSNSCILCGKGCRDRKALIKHAWDHSREKSHSCPKCGKNFHNKARLKRHMASHRDKSVVCDVCQEEFPDGRSLSNHRHSHSANSASGKLFPCNECGKTFGSRSSQQIHVRIHTGERPYGCRFCWKAFADGGTLRKHERIHTGEKPYACSVCPRAFNQRVVLREHIRSHHSHMDVKKGTYYCAVCTDELPSSTELMQHLIEHSDKNTAMQRQPVTGPRKYKRRRKLKPHEIARMRDEYKRNGNGSDIDICDFDMDNVDDLLGLSSVASTSTGKDKKASDKSAKPKAAGKRTKTDNNNRKANNKNRNSKGGDYSQHDDDDNLEMDENGSETANGNDQTNQSNAIVGDQEVDIENVEVDVGEGCHVAPKRSMKAEKLLEESGDNKMWEEKIMTSNESLLSNWEQTFLGMDSALVVSDNNGTSGGAKKYKYKSEEGSSQRTQIVERVKTETKSSLQPKARTKKMEKTASHAAGARARMIHTEKWLVANDDGDGSKRRSRSYITRTEHSSMELLQPVKSSIVNDYEIISPESQVPNQISSSPVHIKQEQDSYPPQRYQCTEAGILEPISTGNELYKAQMMMHTSTRRKTMSTSQYDPSIVNDLEDILQSPIKSDRLQLRQRYAIESSPQFMVEEQQHFIKIEPTSPDLCDIVVSTGSNSGVQRRSTRATRQRLNPPNRKYLDYDTNLNTPTRSQMSVAISPTSTSSAAPSTPNRNTKRRPPMTKTSIRRPASKGYHPDYDVNALSSLSNGRSDSSTAIVANVDHSAFGGMSVATVPPTPTMETKQQPYFECEMCSAVFPDRAQLLDHVPIHI